MARIAFAAVLLLLVSACNDTTTAPVLDIPEPVAVTADDVPAPGDGIYFYIGMTAQDDAKPLLKEALRRGVRFAAAWLPQYQTPCAAPTATAALVVQVTAYGDRLSDLGFRSDPEPWLVNCGIGDFWKYVFMNRTAGQFLFEVAYVNYAWGRRINGYFVDRTGAVYRYNHDDADWRPKGDDTVTGDELRKKFQNLELVGRVNGLTLARMQALIEPASRGSMSDPVSVCRDAGTTRFLAYRYDAKADVYHLVLLYQVGDWAEKNLSDDATKLYTWLFDVVGYTPQECLP